MRMTVREFKVQYALGTLSQDKIMRLAKNISTARGILTILSRSEDQRIRCCVAKNINLRFKDLMRLREDKMFLVREAANRGITF